MLKMLLLSLHPWTMRYCLCVYCRSWLRWVFVAVRGLLIVMVSLVVAHGFRCSAACGIFPDQGSNPWSPALAGRFLTTAPPGKSKGTFNTTSSSLSQTLLFFISVSLQPSLSRVKRLKCFSNNARTALASVERNEDHPKENKQRLFIPNLP